jgi:tRNA (guanosine-2'-O-)-methyltransferase
VETLQEYLLSFVTENKKQLFHSRLEERTRHLTVVLEDIFQPQNTNAVLRTADCFGIQDVHVIENTNGYDINPRVLRGALKWLDLTRYNLHQDNTMVCLQRLKQKGYLIVATSPSPHSIPLHEMPLDRPMALVFGNEKQGISQVVKREADIHMHIPMYGFTESLNVSVSAAICLHHLTTELRRSQVNWRMSDAERAELLYQWTRKVLKDPDGLEKRFRIEVK